MSPEWKIRTSTARDRDWIEGFLIEHWGDRCMVLRGEVVYPAEHPAFLCVEDERPLGLVTYRCAASTCELLSLDSLREGEGIGSALVQAVIERARADQCDSVRLITTNDNLRALGFYQVRGFRIRAVFLGAVDASRKIKPAIPLVGENGISIRDEIELALEL
jgi:Acetyltransferases